MRSIYNTILKILLRSKQEKQAPHADDAAAVPDPAGYDGYEIAQSPIFLGGDPETGVTLSLSIFSIPPAQLNRPRGDPHCVAIPLESLLNVLYDLTVYLKSDGVNMGPAEAFGAHAMFKEVYDWMCNIDKKYKTR